VKVALVILHADPRKGGAEGYTVNLAHALARRGHDVTLVATTFGPQCEPIAQVPLDGRGVTRLGRYRAFLDSLDHHLAQTRYDVVHAIAPVRRCDFYHPQAGLAAEALASGHLKYEGLRRPLDQLATRLNRKRQYVAGVERQALSGPDAPTVLCVSDMVRRTGLAHYPQLPGEKLVTLFNAVDPVRFDPHAKPQAAEEVRQRFGIGPDQVVALIVAQDFKRKGLRPAIEAIARVPDPRLVLLVVGKPDPRPYQQLAARLNVTDRVIFAGPTADTYGFYRAADCFVLPTWHDPCSLVVLEALAMGLPTITTAQNGACEIIEEGRHGYVLADPSDVPGLARGITQLLDPATRRAQREACLALRPRLSYEHHLDQLEALYRQVATGISPSPGTPGEGWGEGLVPSPPGGVMGYGPAPRPGGGTRNGLPST
jgi:UDP-glucose:(heptosyl)LPS alpha-1,3-glucosyltransferase